MTKDRMRIVLGFAGALIFMLIKVVIPEFPVTEDQMLVIMAIFGSYILGESFEGVRVGDNLKLLIKSHKFQATLAGLILVLVKSFYPEFPVSEEQLLMIIGIIVTFVVGNGIAQFSPFGKLA